MASDSTSSRSNSTADSYIGCLISLTSKSEIRYEGILYNVNAEESSIGLRNVRSFGTEGRKKDGPQIPASDKVYEYILFRGTDIKDLQVKSSPPVQPIPPVNTDPAIIQSQYPRPVTTSSLPAVSGSLTDFSSHTTQLGLTGSNYQGHLPLYQPGGNIGSWGAPPTAPNPNGSGVAMPMYWQGYYGAPNGLPHLQQQSLLQPPPGLSMPSSMQQPSLSMPSSTQQPSLSMPSSTQQPNLSMPSSIPQPNLSMPSSMQQPLQFPNLYPSLATGPSNMPEFPSALLPVSSSFPSVTSTSIPPPNLPSTLPPALASETLPTSVATKAPTVSLPTVTVAANLPSLTPFSNGIPDISTVVPPVKQGTISGSSLPYQSVSSLTPVVVGSSNSIRSEAPAPSLITPGQLLQPGPAVVTSSKPSQTPHKDVEVVTVSSTETSEPSVPVSTESQPPILPLPVTTQPNHRPGGAPTQIQHGYGYRGRGRGRGAGSSRPVARFTEDFDFIAMNEKFKKDEVWGHLGKSNKSHSKVIDGDEDASDEGDIQDELPQVEVKPVYNKDDFFDSLSCNALDQDSQNGRIRYSQQIKIDTETFGDFTRHRGGWGGRGGRGGGRPRGGYYGRGYGYGGRGRGRGMSSHP